MSDFALRLVPVPMFDDNYLWLLIAENGATIAIDVGDYAVLTNYLQAQQLQLTTVLITHHHRDHIAGLTEIKKQYPEVAIYGHSSINGITHPMVGGEVLNITNIGRLLVMDVAGHTHIHLAYYHLSEKILFCGDTLFSAGCGRTVDGNTRQLYHALEKIKLLANDTRLCPAHEYTLSNLEFARAIEPNNLQTRDYQTWAINQRAHNQPTLPARLENEKNYNPFLRCHLLKNRIETLTQKTYKTTAELFIALRDYKNNWPY